MKQWLTRERALEIIRTKCGSEEDVLYFGTGFRTQKRTFVTMVAAIAALLFSIVLIVSGITIAANPEQYGTLSVTALIMLFLIMSAFTALGIVLLKRAFTIAHSDELPFYFAVTSKRIIAVRTGVIRKAVSFSSADWRHFSRAYIPPFKPVFKEFPVFIDSDNINSETPPVRIYADNPESAETACAYINYAIRKYIPSVNNKAMRTY